MACNPGQTKGGCAPVIPYEGGTGCDAPAGGTKLIGPPSFVPEITNPPDLTWRDEDFVPIQADDDGSVFVFDNI